ncbi:hypothetical protein BCR42DRAFT_426468 [Absidia repens]|uniref:F-box domain-containing protein n=1 Tax=Absidia repens TaxID=90262 RepID=A0A1X2I181_9FUNG|nr:hypothetical protein BCR42DRAFT_426468 [Absidia repens]
MNNLGHLPAEIVSAILHHVVEKDYYACSLINRSFYKATNPLLWQAPTLRNGSKAQLFMKCLVEAQQQQQQHHHVGKHIRRLTSNVPWTDTDLLQLILPHMSHLEHLALETAKNISDISMEPIAQHCPHLITLHLNGSLITQQTMNALGQHCHQLTNLILDYAPHLSPNTLTPLVHRCPLRKVLLSAYAATGGTWMTVDETVKDLLCFRGLTSLTILGSSPEVLKSVLLQQQQQQVSWPELTVLNLDDGSRDVGDSDFIPFLQIHPGLTELSLTRCELTSATVMAMAAHLPNLSLVDVSQNGYQSLSTTSVRHMVRQCPLLTSLDLSDSGLEINDFPELEMLWDHPAYLYTLKLKQDAIERIRSAPGHGNPVINDQQ